MTTIKKGTNHWPNTGRNQFLWASGLLLAVLGVLFFQSFLPGRTHFNNDGPLGAQVAAAHQVPETFTGGWEDLNSIGFNGGWALPDISFGLKLLLGPVGFSKFYAPFALLFLGLCAWLCLRQFGLTPLACVLGGLAATLNSLYFSTACWGVAGQPITFGLNFLALAALADTSSRLRWVLVALAGLAVGMGVMESADIGVIFSLFIAAFVVYQALTGVLKPLSRVERLVVACGLIAMLSFALVGGMAIGVGVIVLLILGVAAGVTIAVGIWAFCTDSALANRVQHGEGRVVLVAGSAMFIAAMAITMQIGTQVKGIVGAQQDARSRQERWDWATEWSVPKREALGLFVPGLFGLRMAPAPTDGSTYWGAIGRDPAWDRYFDGGRNGAPPPGFLRYGSGGLYAGVLVVLIALWTVFQSLRGPGSAFTPANRNFLWFWLGVLMVSLLLAFGRHAMFYQYFYALPYVSTIRNPQKFMHVFTWALIVLFGYGVHGLSRRYLEVAASGAATLTSHLQNWWAKVTGFDRKWTVGCLAAIGLSLLGWLIYASSRKDLEAYLQLVQFDSGMAKLVAGFSIRQVGWFILLLALAAGLLTLVLSGWFAGRRAKWGGMLLGLLLLADLGSVNRTWVFYWNYPQKYASNPVIDLLRDKPYEHRVAILPFQPPSLQLSIFNQLYRVEWAQQHFQYYNVQSLDIVQMPRTPEDLMAFETALAFDQTPNTLSRIARRWQLTNTRYLLGAAGFLDVLNQELDPTLRRFQIVTRFDITLKPGVVNYAQTEDLTAVLSTNGNYALFEFTGALPRAKLYSNWEVSTNDQATLQQLPSPGFDPSQKVLVADGPPPPGAVATNQNAGTVRFISYAPKRIVLNAQAETPAVLLLNDKYDPNWQVWVDGKREALLRCNFIMRGVRVQPGEHTVEFRFQPPIGTLYVSLAAIFVGLALIAVLLFVKPPSDPPPNQQSEKLPKQGIKGQDSSRPARL
jgi:Bacterial membrane protein YfhO